MNYGMKQQMLIAGGILVALSACNNKGAADVKDNGNLGLAPVKVVKSFRCAEDNMADELAVADFVGAESESLWIRKSQDKNCMFEVLHKSAGGKASVLSPQSGGYLLMAGKTRAGNGEAIACFSNVHHGEHDGSAPDGAKDIAKVTLECAYRNEEGEWREGQTVITPEAEWAPWIRRVEPHATAGRFSVQYFRDRTFQFMNINNKGRLPEEGLYELILEVNANGFNEVSNIQLGNDFKVDSFMAAPPLPPVETPAGTQPGV